MAEKQRMYMMVCWRSPSNWFFFSWPFSFPTLTRALLSCLAQFLLRHLFICACCSTALLRQTPAPPACAPSCPQAVRMWQAQPFTWAGIPGLFELGISSGSGTANSSLAALASWEGHTRQACARLKMTGFLCGCVTLLGHSEFAPLSSVLYWVVLGSESACTSWTLARIVYNLL